MTYPPALSAVTSLRLLLAICVVLSAGYASAIGARPIVSTTVIPGGFPLVQAELPPIVVDSADDVGVLRVAGDFQADVERVCGRKPALVTDTVPKARAVVMVGSLGKSRLLRRLIDSGKLVVSDIQGKWEANVTQVVANPFPGVAKALVLAGSDKRGAVYGVYNLSEQIGVSPWYWWADVRVPHRDSLWVKPGRFVQGEPKVRYRGIFLNDEAPSLTNWVLQNFGDYNHKFYVHVFELLLRLRANYLWPAMWNNCFSEDDPQNPILADQYGIVMGTSHVEPMMRADKEWNRLGYSQNDWNYVSHPKELEKFWRDGVVRNKPYESLTTIAMRGKIDTPMSETANIDLLERIVTAQRKILAENVNRDVTKIPQLWALYKEVQEYYEKGMRVPDDVTLLWCDDNWGNIRRLPEPEEQSRSGGAGVYYHFDYVGGPRNYKWLNTNPLPKIWEQMNLAHHYGADRIWVVNVGSLKTKELPIEFFLTMARDPDAMGKDKVAGFTRAYASRNFGPEHADEIADLLTRYGKYAGRRKPELLDPTTFSLTNYREADRVVAEWEDLDRRAGRLYDTLPSEDGSAFFQLVLHPIRAMRIVNELYVAVAKNRLYAKQGRASAALFAKQANDLFAEDAAETAAFHAINGGKWNHFMDQTHIGYTSWQQPDRNVKPRLAGFVPSAQDGFGVSVEGSDGAWPGSSEAAILPELDPWSPAPRFTVFQKGDRTTTYSLSTPDSPWLSIKEIKGGADSDRGYEVGVDWKSVPKTGAVGHVVVTGANGEAVTIHVPVRDMSMSPPRGYKGFLESRGYVSMQPEHFTSKVDSHVARWEEIPEYGVAGSAMSVFPVDAPSIAITPNSPHLEYQIFSPKSGEVTVETVLSATLGFQPKRGLKIAVSFDGERPQVVDTPARYLSPEWEESVKTNSRPIFTKHTLTPGRHTLKIWITDPGVVVQKILVDFGGLRPSYLGPPECYRALSTTK